MDYNTEKKEAFREAFDDFDPVKIACYTEDKIQELLLNPGIIRCQRKIRAAVTNAGIILKIRAEKGSFSEYLWSFSNHQRIVNTDNHFKTTSDLSDRISKDLKKRGMSYVGSITIYSYLQAIGIVNDHHTECFRYAEIEQGAQQ